MSDEKATPRKPSDRIMAISPEHMRLNMVRMVLEGPATLRRISREQMFVEALLAATETRGVKLTACTTLAVNMRDLSPGKDGLGIDAAVKMLSPVPAMAIPGSAFPAETKPGILDRAAAFFFGRKGDEKK